MNNISMNQALSVWSDLWQAYYGKHGYGGDTAEIYAYRLMPYMPGIERIDDRKREAFRRVAISLRDIVWKFANDNDVLCSIDGESADDWLIHNPYFDYRCHVKIVHLEFVTQGSKKLLSL